MTQDKLLEYWENAIKNHVMFANRTVKVYSSSELKVIEEYIINGKPLPNDFPRYRSYSIYSFPSPVVKELKGGDNAEMAKRILRMCSEVSYYGFGCESNLSKKTLEILKSIDYSLSDVMSEINYEKVSSYSYLSFANSIVDVYADDVKAYITDKEISDAISLKSNKFSIMILMLTKIVADDYENNSSAIDIILKNLNLLVSSNQIDVITRLYSYSDKVREIFNKRVTKDTAYYTAFSDLFASYYGEKKFKEEIYNLGLQKSYCKWCILKNIIFLSNFERNIYKAELLELYNENKERFAEVCLEIINEKQEYNSQNAIYAAVLMNTIDDRKSGIQALEKNISHYVHLLCDEINSAVSRNSKDNKEVSFVELMTAFKSENPSFEDLKLNKLNRWASCGGILSSFRLMCLLYDYFEAAENIVNKLLTASFSEINNKSYDSMRMFGEFYTEFVDVRSIWLGKSEAESIEVLRKILPVEAFFRIYCRAEENSWYSRMIKFDKNEVIRLANENSDTALDMFKNLSGWENISSWLDVYYNIDGEKSFEPLIDSFKAKSKQLRKKAVEIAENYEDEIRPELEKILPKLKGDANITVDKLIRKWDNVRKFGKDFSFSSNEFTEEFCKDNINPSAVKKISWIDEKAFEGIRYADLSGTASPDIFKYILSEYMLLDEPAKLITCDKVAERLNQTDLQDALENIYINWIEDGADTKRKFITLPYCIYASDSQIIRMKKQLETWAAASRGQLAAFVVGNIALNGGSIALLTVDTISKKFKNAQVKNSAKEAIVNAAEILEVSVDELTDKIVPNLDFDKNGERIFDYGERTFTVSLMPDFSLNIHDNAKDKDIKSMPKPNDKDDAVKAEAAKKEFSELKKQIKAVVASQKQRLEKVFMNGRKWTTDKWRELFEENPVMHCFAENLIWGVYDGDNLKATFRYLSDGSFCNEDDDEYELPQNAEITLVHPVELDDEIKAKWSEQLEDYEIVQPFNQLYANVITIEDKEISAADGAVTKYDGRDSVTGKMLGVANKYAMTRGETLDGGGFEGYDFTDDYTGITMHINADMLYFGQGYDENVKIEEVKFTKKGAPVNPLTLGKRFLSECLNIVESMLEE